MKNIPFLLILIGGMIAAGDYFLSIHELVIGPGPSKKLFIIGIIIGLIGLALLLLTK